MIFEPLNAAAEQGELLLVDGGMCHYHLRRDGQLTIREIIVLPRHRHRGIAAQMLKELQQIDGVQSIFAKCPARLAANGWYEHMGFEQKWVWSEGFQDDIEVWERSADLYK